MKKFLPAIFLFTIVFSATLALQVGGANLAAYAKEKTKNEIFEETFFKLDLETINGKKIKTSDIKTPIIIVNFWASWCLPCMEEMPSLVDLKKKFKENEVIILSFNTDENDQQKNIAKTLKKFGITNQFEVIADKNTKIADSFKLTAVPTTMIFSKGKLTEQVNGPIDFNAAEFTEKIKKLLKNN